MHSRSLTRSALVVGIAMSLATAAHAAGDDPDTLVRTGNPERYQVSVSATKLNRRTEDVANGMTVVSGDELRRRGTHTVAEALQDVVGFDTGEGSDNGSLFPNLGMWGLKEFDALLVTVNGVPAGGPFNPALNQIPIEDIDRIEVVKGPQGTLYGMAAFAGMVQIFTREPEEGRLSGNVGGGSFSGMHGNASYTKTLPEGTKVLVSGVARQSDNWQDRTESQRVGGRAVVSRPFGALTSSIEVGYYYDHQEWGTPLPVDQGVALPGFEIDRNYAVGGARMDHHDVSGSLLLGRPISDRWRLENRFNAERDNQINVRSWIDPASAAGPGNPVDAEVVYVRPEINTIFDELRATGHMDLRGRHDLVAGAAVTYGKMELAGEGADFAQTLGDFSTIPDVGSIPAGDLRSGNDKRTFLGVYARDEWTPIPKLTIGGGGRWDQSDETLHAQAQEQGPPLGALEAVDDHQIDTGWSGDLSGLVRLLSQPTSKLDVVNVYGNWKTAFKPAAPNLSEGEGSSILDPEYTHSLEFGVKTRGINHQVGLDLSWFDMTFNNMVVGTPAGLTNAGEERFKGVEVDLTVQPKRIPGSTVTVGYAHHDAKFVHFSFLADPNDPASLRVVDGNELELSPNELLNARVDYVMPMGLGVFGAVRTMGERFLNRRNTFTTDAFSEFDAGASYTFQGRYHASVIGRNLGDDRHYTTESEIGDSMFYVAASRRVNAEVSIDF